MIMLDTNVISEAMNPEPAPAVRIWLDAQAAETLYLSSVTIAELMFGIGALPKGRRKDKLAAALDGVLEPFVNRILAFDTRAARRYAGLAVSPRCGKGLPHARWLYRRDRRRPRLRGRIPRHASLRNGRPHRDQPVGS